MSDLLHEVSEVHHVVYRITDGADDDWASFYADWLIDHSELPAVRTSTPSESSSASADYGEWSTASPCSRVAYSAIPTAVPRRTVHT